MKNLSYLLLVGILCTSVAYSASTADIEALRLRVGDSSTELTTSEKNVISTFWSDTLDEMMLADTSKDCVEIRRQLVAQKGTEYLSNYAAAYNDEAKSAISTAFANAQRLQDPQQRQMVERNLMILTAELENPALAPLALQQLDAEDDIIRYWAFKAVTNSAVVQQLTSEVTGDENAIRAILTDLEKRVSTETQAGIQKMVIHFCMSINDPMARDILLLIADRRIKAYQNWTVSDVLLDTSLLTALGNVAVLQEGSVQTTFGCKFAELYAATIQRYLKGQKVLSEEQIDDLSTVIAEIDQTVLAKTMGIRTGILMALKRKSGLEREYETLFGDRMRPGQLGELFKFDYGKDASGNSITAPPELGPMPENLKTDK